MLEIASVALVLPDGRLVFQRRDGNTKVSPNKVGFFGGKIEQGETPLEAIVREIGEETSLSVTPEQFTKVATYESSEKRYHMFKMDIKDVDFEVYEGIGFEVYTLEQIMKRTDTTHALQIAKEKQLLTSL